jgi:hypothetical protein
LLAPLVFMAPVLEEGQHSCVTLDFMFRDEAAAAMRRRSDPLQREVRGAHVCQGC